jgi:pimeloyl-ACP methyl ester carboxylesterase
MYGTSLPAGFSFVLWVRDWGVFESELEADVVKDINLRKSRANYYDVAGPQGAPAIVLVHGSTVTRKSWMLQVKALQDSYRVISLDLPAHGVLADQSFDFDAAVDLLRDVIQLEAGGKALVVGISLGGHVATLFAARHPDQVAGLVLSGASGNMQGLTGWWMRTVGRLLLRLFKEETMKRNLEKSLRQKWPAEVAQAQIADGLFPRGATQSFLLISKYNYRDLIRRVPAPVLILNGELDRPNRNGELVFAAAAPDARVEIVPGAGHACNVEAPEAYNQRLLTFAEEIGWLAQPKEGSQGGTYETVLKSESVESRGSGDRGWLAGGDGRGNGNDLIFDSGRLDV